MLFVTIMPRNIAHCVDSLRDIDYQDHSQLITNIDLAFKTPLLQGCDPAVIGRGAAVGLDEIFAVPIQVSYIGRNDSEIVAHYKVRRSSHFAYYEKQELGSILTFGPLLNLDDIHRKAKRYAELITKIFAEYQESEVASLPIKINLFTRIYPYRQKRILEMNTQDLKVLPPAEDLTRILANQQPSRPCL